MTEQEIFDKAKTHLLTQMEKAEDNKGNCRYRSPDGKQCALGCLIPAELYDPRIEGCAMHSFNNMWEAYDSGEGIIEDYTTFRRIIQEAVGELTDHKRSLLKALQDVHDDSNPENWAYALEQVRTDFGLV